jgi:hypothetical protein
MAPEKGRNHARILRSLWQRGKGEWCHTSPVAIVTSIRRGIDPKRPENVSPR